MKIKQVIFIALALALIYLGYKHHLRYEEIQAMQTLVQVRTMLSQTLLQQYIYYTALVFGVGIAALIVTKDK